MAIVQRELGDYRSQAAHHSVARPLRSVPSGARLRAAKDIATTQSIPVPMLFVCARAPNLLLQNGHQKYADGPNKAGSFTVVPSHVRSLYARVHK